MHFYRVPRLGSFMAIPMTHKTCLYEESLDFAVQDFLDVQRKREDIEKQKIEFEDLAAKEREEKEKLGEIYVPEEREWPTVELQEIHSSDEFWIIGLDTLGQDREFTDQEKRFALETV